MKYIQLFLPLFIMFSITACSNTHSSDNQINQDPFTSNKDVEVRYSTVGGGVATNSQIALFFKNPVDAGSINSSSVLLQRVSDGAIQALQNSSPSADSTSNIVLVYAPFTSNTNYKLTLTTAITDTGGTPLDKNYTYDFRTAASTDTTQLEVNASLDGDTNASLFSSIKLQFSEAIDHTSYLDTDFALTDSNSTVIPITIRRGSSLMMITPNKPLAANMTYTLNGPSSITDLAGNGILSPLYLTFSTQNDIIFKVSDANYKVRQSLFMVPGSSSFAFLDTNNTFIMYDYNDSDDSMLFNTSNAFTYNSVISSRMTNNFLYTLDRNGTQTNLYGTDLTAFATATAPISLPFTDVKQFNVNFQNTKACLVRTEANATQLMSNDSNITDVPYPSYCYIDDGNILHIFSDTKWRSYRIIPEAGTTSGSIDNNISNDNKTSIVATVIGAVNRASFAFTNKHTLLASGLNTNQVLGNGTTTNANQFQPATINAPIVYIASSKGDHVLAMDAHGSLWSWGDNLSGQVGDGSQADVGTPYNVLTSAGWKNISAGANHSMALENNGTLWGWGDDSSSQLEGNGSTTSQLTPNVVASDGNWSDVSAGGSFTLAVEANGTLWGWGKNDFAQVSADGTTSTSVPIKAQIGTDNNWTRVFACVDYAYALKNDGTLWGWGNNSYDQLATGNTSSPQAMHQIGTNTNWKTMACGAVSGFSYGLQTDGTLWAIGHNTAGELGDGTTISTSSFVQIGTNQKWTDVRAGGYAGIALAEDGTVWTWGLNSSGQLGFDDTTNRLVPTLLPTGVVNQAIQQNNYIYTLRNSTISRYDRSTGTLDSSYDVNDSVVLEKVVFSGGFAFAYARERSELFIFDISKKGIDGGITLYKVFDTSDPITSISALYQGSQTRLLVGHSTGSQPVQSYDINTLTTLSFNTSTPLLNSNSHNAEMVAHGDYLYVGSDTSISVYNTIYNGTDSFALVNTYPSNGNIVSMRYYNDGLNDYLITSKESNGVDVYEINASTSPVSLNILATINNGFNARDAIAVGINDGSYLAIYIGTQSQGIYVYDESNITAPLFHQPMNSSVSKMAIGDSDLSTLMVGDTSNNLTTYDIDLFPIEGTGGNITYNSTYPTPSAPLDIYFDSYNNTFYVALGSEGLGILDCSSGCTTPSYVKTPGFASRIDTVGGPSGRVIYLADYTGISLLSINGSNGVAYQSHLPTPYRAFDVTPVLNASGGFNVVTSDGNSTLYDYTIPALTPTMGQ